MSVRFLSKKHKRQRAFHFGILAEKIAAGLLRLKGYRIVHRRYKTPVGEIDLIARNKKRILFVEVKARQALPADGELVTRQQQHRIVRAAEWFLMKHGQKMAVNVRFDLIVLTRRGRIRHYQNAWGQTSESY